MKKTIVLEFPDYFRVVGGGNRDEDGVLELVYWSDELAVSVMEKKGSIAFPMQFSRGFSRRSGKMSGRSCLTFLHMKMLLIFCQIVMNRVSGRLQFCMSCFIFLCQRRLRDNLL